MAHFMTIVIVNPSNGNPARQAEKLMLPYFAPDLGPRGARREKCDGFAIGGAWDGVLYGKPLLRGLAPREFEAGYGLGIIKEPDNIRALGELPRNLDPFAIVTPDGTWLDVERKTPLEWNQEVASLIDGYPSHFLAVVMDCHC